jgi:heme iron utilization protein
MNAEESANLVRLIRSQRTAALGTLADGAPFVSFVAYAAEATMQGYLLHLSQLAPHTRQLQADPRCSLLITEQDDGRDDVQTLARITLNGRAQSLLPDHAGYASARACYLEHFPAATMLFEFRDFALYRFVPEHARYIGGFARAYSLTQQQLWNLGDMATG